MKDLPVAGFFEIAKVFFGSLHQYVCDGDSMNPTLKDSEKILVDRNAAVEIGDIVVARHPFELSAEVVKRVASISERGHFYLIGDNLADSEDSRHYGALSPDYIKGKVIARLS